MNNCNCSKNILRLLQRRFVNIVPRKRKLLKLLVTIKKMKINCLFVLKIQVGFTTPSDRGKSSRYSSDLAKVVNSPIFHVNGDDPEAVMIVTKIALEYQQRFAKEVFVELHCFRRWGHNELDDPTFTNPLLYQQIHNRYTTLCTKLYDGKKLKIDCVVPKLYYKNIKISFRIGTQTLVLM